jgi:hypothetical protein
MAASVQLASLQRGRQWLVTMWPATKVKKKMNREWCWFYRYYFCYWNRWKKSRPPGRLATIRQETINEGQDHHHDSSRHLDNQAIAATPRGGLEPVPASDDAFFVQHDLLQTLFGAKTTVTNHHIDDWDDAAAASCWCW